MYYFVTELCLLDAQVLVRRWRLEPGTSISPAATITTENPDRTTTYLAIIWFYLLET
jgi:hypothetical protein